MVKLDIYGNEVIPVLVNITKKFDFTPTDIEALSTASKDHKYKPRINVEIIYNKDLMDKFDYFLRSIRLLEILYAKFEQEQKHYILCRKLDKLLVYYDDDYRRVMELKERMTRGREWGKRRIISSMNLFFLRQKNRIHALIGFVYPFGFRKQQLDPGQTQGHY